VTGRAALAVLVAAAAALPAAGCSSGHSEAQCAWVLRYDGRRYVLATAHGESITVRHRGARIGHGTLLGCADGPTGDQRLTVYRVPGVAPEVAVTTSRYSLAAVVDPAHLPPAVRALAARPRSGGSPGREVR
jgi:hypothetical protein